MGPRRTFVLAVASICAPAIMAFTSDTPPVQSEQAVPPEVWHKAAKLSVNIGGIPVMNYENRLRQVGELVASNDTDDPRRLEEAKHVKSVWIIVLKKEATDEKIKHICADSKHHHMTCKGEGHPSTGGVALIEVEGSETDLEPLMLKHQGEVSFIEPDGEVKALPVATAADPRSLHHLNASYVVWGLDRVDQRTGRDGVYNSTLTGEGVHVYVVDTGVRVTHTDFSGRAVPAIESLGSGVVECSNTSTTCANDADGHGTHCAGTVGGTTFGVAKHARLHSAKVLGADGGKWSWILLAEDWIARKGMRPAIASMSLGGRGQSPSQRRAVQAMVTSGVTVVVAGGNENDDACEYSPAFIPEAITVGATSQSDSRAGFSNYGRCVDLFAPGVGIESAYHSSNTISKALSGTSMACPHVAGAAALLLEGDTSLTPLNVTALLLLRATLGSVQNTRGSPNALLYVGDGATMTMTTTTSTLFSLHGLAWGLAEGNCGINAITACAWSTNYPGRYGNKEYCRIVVNQTQAAPLVVHHFNTERGWDFVSINGMSYSGTRGPTGVVPKSDIIWRSDTAGVSTGWWFCMGGRDTSNTTMTTTTTVPISFGGLPWVVLDGACGMSATTAMNTTTACIRSPNYPLPYGHNQACRIALNDTRASALTVHHFDTETNFDRLIINGRSYSGSIGPNGVIPRGTVRWSTDGSVDGTGWKICMGGNATNATNVTNATSTTTTPLGPVNFSGRPWVVMHGNCSVNGSCAWSPNHPQNYNNSQTCVLAVNVTAAGPLNVLHFQTERGYDKLAINGREYHGSGGPHAVTPRGNILWSSDSSVTESGWKMCMGGNITNATSTTTTPSGPVNFTGRPWVVIHGGCVVDGLCARSPNYPQNYWNNQMCRISVNDTAALPLNVLHFQTEFGWDKLTVNGRYYHGSWGPHAVTPRGNILWSSDSSVTRSGWKMCMGGVNITTTTSTTMGNVTFGGLPWVVMQGHCGVDRFCAWSPNYPGSYWNNQRCTIIVNNTAAARLQVLRFDTESFFDELTVNGKAYSGYSDGPMGVKPQGMISWFSDYSATQQGWKMCMGGNYTNFTNITRPTFPPWATSYPPFWTTSTSTRLPQCHYISHELAVRYNVLPCNR